MKMIQMKVLWYILRFTMIRCEIAVTFSKPQTKCTINQRQSQGPADADLDKIYNTLYTIVKCEGEPLI
jgi:hypothetical protein